MPRLSRYFTMLTHSPEGNSVKRILLLSIESNSIRLSGPAHGIVTKTVLKTLPGGTTVGVVGVMG